MQKFIIPLFLVAIFVGCVNQRAVMDSWLGLPKHDLIMKWGPPAREASDGSTGEILIYSNQFYNSYNNTTMYKYTMFYADNDGKIYHWMIQSGFVPPQQINMNLYVH